MSWVATVCMALFTLVFGVMIVMSGYSGFWNAPLKDHLPSVIGLPIGAIASLVIVLILRTVAGDIEKRC